MNRKPTGTFSRIQSLAAPAAALAIAGALMACSHNAVIKPQANILKNGSYRSRIEAGAAPVTGLSMQLNGNGRFSMATLQGGCFVSEDFGSWSSSQEELTLSVQKSMRRADCASPWRTVRRDTSFICPMRSVTDNSFQMLHDEIAQGTVWTAWEREASQGYAELERLRLEPDTDKVTMDAPQAPRKNGSGKDRSAATRTR
jgi:hypothetical protein